MCPLRVILLFLSAMLAGYFAIKTVRAQGESSVLELHDEEPEKAIEQTGLLAKVCALGFRAVASPSRALSVLLSILNQSQSSEVYCWLI
jgi:hypothetical protein